MVVNFREAIKAQRMRVVSLIQQCISWAYCILNTAVETRTASGTCRGFVIVVMGLYLAEFFMLRPCVFLKFIPRFYPAITSAT
jgi:hypothetical protein